MLAKTIKEHNKKRNSIDVLFQKLDKLTSYLIFIIMLGLFVVLFLFFYLYCMHKYGGAIYTYSEDAYEYLDQIVDTVIVEGEGLYIYKFPKDVVSYSIDYNDENIIFKCCVENGEQEIFAKSARVEITLSKEFEILKKDFNYPSNEQYQKAVKIDLILYAILLSIGTLSIICITFIMFLLICAFADIFKKKKI